MLPTFLIIGAMKSGTTALYHMAGSHPEIFMSPVKEPNFFAFAGRELDFQAPIDRSPHGINHTSITDREAYEALFDEADPDQARGEASHTSLYWPDAAEHVARLVPDARLIAILRNPVERAYSEFLHFVRDDDEPITDFAKALEVEPDRIERNWALGRYVDRGRYDEQLERYLQRFDREQLRVFLHDDLTDSPTDVARALFEHVGVDPSFVPDTDRRVNKSGVPQSRWMHRMLRALQPVREAVDPVLPEAVVDWATVLKNRNLQKPSMDPAVRGRLVETFRPHVRRLENLIDRDLSHWLDTEP
jgi:hypothetical protein